MIRRILILMAIALCTMACDPDESEMIAGKNLDLSKTAGTVIVKEVVILKGDMGHTKNLVGKPCHILKIKHPNISDSRTFGCVSEENYNAVMVNDPLPITPLATVKTLASVAGLIIDRSFDPEKTRWYIVVYDYEKYMIYRVAPELYYKLDIHQRLPLELK